MCLWRGEKEEDDDAWVLLRMEYIEERVRWRECNCARAAHWLVWWCCGAGKIEQCMMVKRRRCFHQEGAHQGDLLAACLPCPLFLTSHSLHEHPTHIRNTGMGVSRRAWRPHLASFLLPLVLFSTSTDGFGPLHAQRLSPLHVPLNAAPGQSKHAHTAKATSRRRATSSSWSLQVRLPCLWCFLQPSLHPTSLLPPAD